MVAAGALLLGACGGGGADKPAVALDGSPRVPDAEGVVVKASSAGITLNKGRTYRVSPDLIAFSTYNRKAIQLAATIGDYVQIGLDGNEVQWVSLVGIVQVDEQGHRTTSYQGTLVAVKGKQLTFRDGTVLRLAPNLTPPKNPFGSVYAAIDVDRCVVQGATFPPSPDTKD